MGSWIYTAQKVVFAIQVHRDAHHACATTGERQRHNHNPPVSSNRSFSWKLQRQLQVQLVTQTEPQLPTPLSAAVHTSPHGGMTSRAMRVWMKYSARGGHTHVLLLGPKPKQGILVRGHNPTVAACCARWRR